MMESSEQSWIAQYMRPLVSLEGTFGLLDDAACLNIPDGMDLVITKDMLCAGTHFFADDPPRSIAQKALRVNISDLIAKGAQPYGYSLGLALPEIPSDAFMIDFTDGLRHDQEYYDIALVGGDTTRLDGPLVISITTYGLVPQKRMVTRLGAQAGMGLYVSGTIGDAALGLQTRLASNLFDASLINPLYERYLLPRPPLALAPVLLKHCAASMDISDGLLGDLQTLCLASGVGADVMLEHIPHSQEVQDVITARPDLLTTALTGGDDYQCLMCVPAQYENVFVNDAAAVGVSTTKIGIIRECNDRKVTLFKNGHKTDLPIHGYSHLD